MPDTTAGAHPFDPAGNQHTRSAVRIFIADAAVRNVAEGCNPGMRMQPKTIEVLALSIEEIEECERLQKTAKVGWRHQASDRAMVLAAGSSGDAGLCVKHRFAFLSSITGQLELR